MADASYRPETHRDARALIDRVAADWGDVIWLLGRVLIGGIFVHSGFGKITDVAGFSAMLAARGVPMTSVMGPIGAGVEFFGGLALVLGFATRYAALLMAAFVVVATAISHRFWTLPEPQQPAQMIQFAKNVAIFGGMLFVFVTGGGRYSLDRLWRPRA